MFIRQDGFVSAPKSRSTVDVPEVIEMWSKLVSGRNHK
jgi:hypothetical protein